MVKHWAGDGVKVRELAAPLSAPDELTVGEDAEVRYCKVGSTIETSGPEESQWVVHEGYQRSWRPETLAMGSVESRGAFDVCCA
jgi:hypothetical protein